MRKNNFLFDSWKKDEHDGDDERHRNSYYVNKPSSSKHKRTSSIEKELSKRYKSRNKKLIKTDQKSLNYDYSSIASSKHNSRVDLTPQETPNFDFKKVPRLQINFEKIQKSNLPSSQVSIRRVSRDNRKQQRVAAPFRSQGLRKRLEKYSDLINFEENYTLKKPTEKTRAYKPSIIKSLLKQ